MKKLFCCIFLSFFILGFLPIAAQTIPVNDKTLSKKYPFINSSINKVSREKELNSFFQKLYLLKKEGKGTVSVVHIGDSHIQADYFTSVVRNSLQQFFGDAGRGLVFPYQLAQSNAPPDMGSFSNNAWQFNRVAHPEIPIASGISGYCIQTNDSIAAINLYLKNSDTNRMYSFNRLKIFSGNADWILQANHNNNPFLVKNEETDSTLFREVVLDQPADSFSLTSLPSDNLKKFYGVSLEISKPGVIYHTIGVNGATYDSYNTASLFWQQLPALKADLYIISLGTNEAQKIGLDQNLFMQQMNSFLEKLKATAPDAAILITTPADDYYKRRRPNIMLKQISNSIAAYCNRHSISLWDMYHITGGYRSAYHWLRRGMMNKDRVHYTNDGYHVQASFFFNAFAKAYNNYASSQ